jgi:hypothetical protein
MTTTPDSRRRPLTSMEATTREPPRRHLLATIPMLLEPRHQLLRAMITTAQEHLHRPLPTTIRTHLGLRRRLLLDMTHTTREPPRRRPQGTIITTTEQPLPRHPVMITISRGPLRRRPRIRTTTALERCLPPLLITPASEPTLRLHRIIATSGLILLLRRITATSEPILPLRRTIPTCEPTLLLPLTTQDSEPTPLRRHSRAPTEPTLQLLRITLASALLLLLHQSPTRGSEAFHLHRLLTTASSRHIVLGPLKGLTRLPRLLRHLTDTLLSSRPDKSPMPRSDFPRSRDMDPLCPTTLRWTASTPLACLPHVPHPPAAVI